MILIVGARGQLGSCLVKLLPRALATDVDTLDITDARAVKDFVRQHGVKTIINCAAYTAVDAAENEPEKAHALNALAPKYLAMTGATLMHISTDYVFDGKHHLPCTELDATNPASVYGNTKLAGEQAVLESATTAVIIRTSWLYSEFGKNFLKTMLHLGSTRDSLDVVCDQIGSPTYAADLASAIVHILPRIKPGIKEVYNYSNEGVCSWYDFATFIVHVANLPCTVFPIPAVEYPTPAYRPPYSVLDKTKIKQHFGVEIPHWHTSLLTCISNIQSSHA